MTGPGDTETDTPPASPPSKNTAADLWEHLVKQGMPKAQATAAVKAQGMGMTSDATADAPSVVHPTAQTRPEIAFGANAVNGMSLGTLKAMAPQGVQQQFDRMQREHPIASGAGSFVGSVASPLNAVAGAAAQATKLPRLGQAIIRGGLTGGTMGATSAPEGSRLKGAAIGAGLGAGVGGVADLATDWAAPGIRRAAGKAGVLPPEPTVAGTQADLEAAQGAQATPAYKAAMDSPPITDVGVTSRIWRSQEFAPVYERARAIEFENALAEGREPDMPTLEELQHGAPLSVRGFDAFKKEADAHINGLWAKPENQNMAKSLSKSLAVMRNAVDPAAPAYGVARGGYDQHQQVIDALGNPESGGGGTGFSHSPKYMAGKALVHAAQTDAAPEAAANVHALTPDKVPLVKPELLQQAQRAAPLPYASQPFDAPLGGDATQRQFIDMARMRATPMAGSQVPSLLAKLAEQRANQQQQPAPTPADAAAPAG